MDYCVITHLVSSCLSDLACKRLISTHHVCAVCVFAPSLSPDPTHVKWSSSQLEQQEAAHTGSVGFNVSNTSPSLEQGPGFSFYSLRPVWRRVSLSPLAVTSCPLASGLCALWSGRVHVLPESLSLQKGDNVTAQTSHQLIEVQTYPNLLTCMLSVVQTCLFTVVENEETFTYLILFLTYFSCYRL